jgi:hypothetical protein
MAAEAIEVRMHEEAAIISYQSQLEISVQGPKLDLRRYGY